MEGNMRKKVILTLLCIIGIYVLTGCGQEKKENNDEYVEIQMHKSYCNDLVVESQSNMEYSTIYFYDYSSDSEVYACSQANCTHSVEDYGAGKINCNAIVEGDARYPFLYNEKLYYFLGDNDSEVLWCSNVDGTNKEKVLEMDFPLDDYATFSLRQGKLYVSSGIRETIDYDEQSATEFEVESEVYEINLHHKKIRQLTHFGKKPTSICNVVQCFENKIYIKYNCMEKTYTEAGFKDGREYIDWMSDKNFTYAEDIKRLGKKQNYYVYNLKTDTLEKLDIDFESAFEPYKGIEDTDCYYILCVKDSKIFYLDTTLANNAIFMYDLKTKKREQILKKYQILYYYKDGKIYLSSTDMDESTKDELVPSADFNIPPQYYIYDVENEKLINQDYGEKGKFYYVIDDNEDGLLAYETKFDSRYTFLDEHSFCEIPKNKVKEK